MGRSARTKSAERRAKERRAEKEQTRARYAGYAAAGANSKRARIEKARKGGKLVQGKDPNNVQSLLFRKNFQIADLIERREEERRYQDGLVLTRLGEYQMRMRQVA